MSTDKPRVMPSRPLIPKLAPHALRTSPAPKLSPHIAASNTSTSRRPQISSTNSEPFVAKQDYERTIPARIAANTNITPRSSSRKSRPNSAQSTPTTSIHEGIAKAKSPSVAINDNERQVAGSSIQITSSSGFSSLPNIGKTTKLLLSPTLQPSNSHSNADVDPTQGKGGQNASFFHADDIVTPHNSTSRPIIQKHTSGFLYADGKTEASDNNASAVPSSTAGQSGGEMAQGNMNGKRQRADSRATPSLLRSAAVSPSIQSHPFVFQTTAPNYFRAPSPPKDSIHLTYRKGASQILRPNTIGPAASTSIQNRRLSQDMKLRQISIDSGTSRKSHQKASSVSSTSSGPMSRYVHIESKLEDDQQPRSTMVGDSTVLHNGRASSEYNPNAVTQPLVSHVEAEDILKSPTTINSGDAASQSHGDLAANARRERKVLDLEISNSSLLAINRSLEREVRKQKAELRRLRRLSRQTRPSWLSESSSILSGGMSRTLDDDNEFDDPAIGNDDEQDDVTDDESFEDEALSPGAQAASDEKYRKGDERLFKLDLAKHKELLIDSQKMNQGLKRCLGLTEQLIKDGNKALAYQIKVSEIEIGGRVLSLEEQEPDGEMREASDFFEEHEAEVSNQSHYKQEQNLVERSSYGIASMDRDSGVELEIERQFSH